MQISPISNGNNQPVEEVYDKQFFDAIAEKVTESIADTFALYLKVPDKEKKLSAYNAIFVRLKDHISDHKLKDDHLAEIEKISNELKTIPFRNERDEFSAQFLRDLIALGLLKEVANRIELLLHGNGFKVFLYLSLAFKKKEITDEERHGYLQNGKFSAKEFNAKTDKTENARELSYFLNGAFLIACFPEEFNFAVKIFSELPCDKLPPDRVIEFLESKKTGEATTLLVEKILKLINITPKLLS